MKRYIDEFIHRWKCASDLLVLGLFPNGKEITESMSAYHAVKKYILDDVQELKDESIFLVSVGDGCVPRTAALFAFMTKWQCWSVDPLMRSTDWSLKIKRLTVCPHKVEDIKLEFDCNKLIIVNVHSHAPLNLVLPNIVSINPNCVRSVMVLECCVKMDIPGKPFIGYTDQEVWSPCNLVKIWKDV